MTFRLDSIIQLILVRIHKPMTLRYREVFCRALLRYDVHTNLSKQVRIAARLCPFYTVLGDNSRLLLHTYTVRN